MRGNGKARRPGRSAPPGARRTRAAHGRPERVDLGHYVPTVVSSFADKLLASSVAFLRHYFGISRLEWRVLSYLAGRRGAPTAYRIWNEINADKGAISRTLRSLSDKGLVRVRDVTGGRRRTRVELTPQGRRLQAATVGVILERQRCLLEGVSRAEVDALLDIIKRLHANIPKMDAVLERPALRRAAVVKEPASLQERYRGVTERR